MKLNLMIEKLQKGLTLLGTKGPQDDQQNESDDELEVATPVIPKDVTEGHFAVFAMKGKEPQRFVVKLDSLNDPAFLRLLEQAKKECGFQQKGALAVPCKPDELRKILGVRRDMSRTGSTCTTY